MGPSAQVPGENVLAKPRPARRSARGSAIGAKNPDSSTVRGGITIDRLAVGGREVPRYLLDTMLRVNLPAPVRTGESVTIDVAWHFTVPVNGASRMGREGQGPKKQHPGSLLYPSGIDTHPDRGPAGSSRTNLSRCGASPRANHAATAASPRPGSSTARGRSGPGHTIARPAASSSVVPHRIHKHAEDADILAYGGRISERLTPHDAREARFPRRSARQGSARGSAMSSS